MFDIAWSELLLIVVLMLVVMGPKDLPKMMNSIGKMLAKARGFAREFTGSFNQMAKEAELDDIIKKANRAQTIRPSDIVKSALDPDGDIDHAFARNSILKETKAPKSTPKKAPRKKAAKK